MKNEFFLRVLSSKILTVLVWQLLAIANSGENISSYLSKNIFFNILIRKRIFLQKETFSSQSILEFIESKQKIFVY